MRMPSFSRQSATDTADDRPTAANGSTVARPDDATTTHFPTVGAAAGRDGTRTDRGEVTADLAAPAARTDKRTEHGEVTADLAATKADHADIRAGRAEAKADDAMAARDRSVAHDAERAHGPVLRDKKPRASLMATLGLILGVVSALLVLSGPLLGYGIVLAVLALVVSLAGVFATRRRHVAGKSDALIGMVLSLAAIVVGVLALTGSLSWLGTDMQPVDSLREWLDARFVDRF